MLGKLIKYEFRATARAYLPIYGLMALLTLSVLVAGGYMQDVSLVSGQGLWWRVLLVSVYGLTVFALLVLTLIVTVNRFYKNLLGNEGYLMFTLPVTTAQNIFAKLLPSLVWIFVSTLAVAFSAILLFAQADLRAVLDEVLPAIGRAIQDMGLGNFLLLAGEVIILALLGAAATLLNIYLALAIGQLANEHKFLASFGAYLGLQSLEQFLVLFLSFAGRTRLTDWGEWLIENLNSLSGVHTTLLLTILVSLLSCALLYIPTWLLLDKKLNLS